MKTIKTLLFITAVLFAAACSSENLTPEVEYETLSINVSTVDTRTYMAENNPGMVLWNEADYIFVFDEETGTRHKFEHKTGGVFTCDEWPSGAVPSYALFNRDDDYTDQKVEGGAVYASVPATQTVTNPGSFAQKANTTVGKVTGSAGAYSVELKNICGLVKFTITDEITKVKIEATGGEMLAGWLNITETEGVFSWTSASDAHKSSAIELTTLLDSGTNSYAGTYYFCALPGLIENGIKVTMTLADNTTSILSSPNPMTVKRGEIVNLGQLNFNDGKPATKVINMPITTSQWKLACGKNESSEEIWTASSSTTAKTGPDPYTITLGGEIYTTELYGGLSSGASQTYYSDNSRYYMSGADSHILLPKIEGYEIVQVDITAAATKKYQLAFKKNDDSWGTVENLQVDEGLSHTYKVTDSHRSSAVNFYMRGKQKGAILSALSVTYQLIDE